MYRCFQHRIGADLGLHYVKCPKVPLRVSLAIFSWRIYFIKKIEQQYYDEVADLLLISYQFVKPFLAITIYYFLFLAETYMMCVNVFVFSFFLCTQKQIFNWIRQKMKISPKGPIVKIS